MPVGHVSFLEYQFHCVDHLFLYIQVDSVEEVCLCLDLAGLNRRPSSAWSRRLGRSEL